jgi:hypothetical protein
MSKIGRKIKDTAKRVGRLFNRGRIKVGRSMKSLQKKVESLNIFNQNKINSVNEMSEIEQITAEISNQTYKKNREPFIENYQLQDRGSDNSTAVYLDKQKNHLVIGFRGTKSIQDVITDYEIGRGNELDSKRFKEDLQKYDEIVGFYQPSTITLTGHSLGGNICLKINAQKDNVNNVIIFNPAINQNDVKNNFTIQNKNNITILRTAADPVSILSPLLTKATIKTLQLDDSLNLLQIHSIDNFF